MPYAELTIDQGSTFETSITITGDDGDVLNVTNYTFASSIRKSYYSSNAAANITVGIMDANTGNINLFLSAATTSNLKAGRYLYDVKMTDTANNSTRIVEGILIVTPQVTR
jgi:hypothetical protein